MKENLSFSSINLHKSVVSTFCPVESGPPLSSHVIVKRALKAIGLNRPNPPKPPIWDVKIVCDFISNNSVVNLDNLFEVSQRCAILLLLCSGRRIHDLTLLRISSKDCVFYSDSVILWPAFGSKTDSRNHRQSGWKLLSNQTNINIDPVFWLKRLISISEPIRGNLDSLFITTCGIVKPASQTVIGGWVKALLKTAGIDSSPGSVRSAVASASWLDNHGIGDILARGNWKCASTFHNFYKREILSRDANSNVVLDSFAPT